MPYCLSAAGGFCFGGRRWRGGLTPTDAHLVEATIKAYLIKSVTGLIEPRE